MEDVKVSAGKLRGLNRIADKEGRLRMLAIDQRGSLRRMLGKALSREAVYQDLAAIKKAVVKILSPWSSATLIDPVYGYPQALKYFPKEVGLLITLEETGADKGGRSGKERKSKLIEGWDAVKTRRLGADAAKLLIYYRGDASADVLEHQKGIAREVGRDCAENDLPYVLELVGYPFKGDEEKDNLTFAKRKPEIVFDYVSEFSKPEYGVDLLKVEFPADLKYCREFAAGEFDGQKREPAYDLSEVRDFCRRVTEFSRVPWVILSAGVEIAEFAENVRIATGNGASGFLGGRAIWQDCVDSYPDIEAVEQWLSSSGVDNLRRLYAASQGATPYFEARPFHGYPKMKLEGLGEGWYRDY